MKRVAAGLFLICVLFAMNRAAIFAGPKVPVKRRLASASAMKTAPVAAFQKPDPGTFALNVKFWTGYQAGEVVAIPGPSGAYPTWWGYIAAVRKLELPRVKMLFFPDAYNTGVDSSMEAAAAYFWQNDPMSCGVAVCQ